MSDLRYHIELCTPSAFYQMLQDARAYRRGSMMLYIGNTIFLMDRDWTQAMEDEFMTKMIDGVTSNLGLEPIGTRIRRRLKI